jgi:hypothetical protein
LARQTDIRIRRSAVSGAIPLPANLNLGELALNTADGKAYMKKSIGGVDTVIEIGSSDPGSIYSSFEMFEYTAQVANQTTFSGADQNSNTLDYNTGSGTNLPQVQVYLNGILLDYGTDFTATNGSSVVFSVAVSAGDLIQIAAYKSNVTVTADLDLADNQKILLGDDDDLEIYHDGLKSIINDTGTGNLQFQIGGTEIFESTSDGIVLADGLDVEATEFIGDLRGSVLFKAQAGEALSKGDVVTITGISGNTTVVSKADADDASLMPAFGVAAETVSINAPVDIYSFGIMSNLTTNINGWTEGSPLYVSTIPGEMTDVPPSGSASLIQQIAKITKIHPSTGSIDITGAGRANATPNLDEGKIFVGNSSNRSVQVDDTIHVDMANSRVGINTAAPSTPLHVVSGTTDYIARFESSDTTAGIELKDSTSTAAIRTQNGHLVYIADTGNAVSSSSHRWNIDNLTTGEKMRLNAAGELGIGTTSPAQKLHVIGSGRFRSAASGLGSFIAVGNQTETAGNYSAYYFGNTSNDTGYFKGGIAYETLSTTHGRGDMHFLQRSDTGGGNADISHSVMTILNSGNVGIGTTDPQTKLHVSDAVQTGFATLKVENSHTTSGIGTGSSLQFDGWDAGVTANIKSVRTGVNYSPSALTFETYGGAGTTGTNSLAERMRIDEFGNVGIGTTSPTHKLQVSGTTYITNGFGDPNVEAAYRLKFYDNGGTYNDAGIGLDGSGGGGENMWFNALNGFYWNFGTNGKKMVLLTNGNLGIGVTVPKAKLQVEEYGIDTTTSSTAAITQVAIHTFPIADFRSAKCTIQVTNTTDSTYHITEMLMIHNGTTVSITEYGTVYTGSAAEATFDADISSTNLRLLATPATTDGMTFKVVCHSITV